MPVARRRCPPVSAPAPVGRAGDAGSAAAAPAASAGPARRSARTPGRGGSRRRRCHRARGSPRSGVRRTRGSGACQPGRPCRVAWDGWDDSSAIRHLAGVGRPAGPPPQDRGGHRAGRRGNGGAGTGVRGAHVTSRGRWGPSLAGTAAPRDGPRARRMTCHTIAVRRSPRRRHPAAAPDTESRRTAVSGPRRQQYVDSRRGRVSPPAGRAAGRGRAPDPSPACPAPRRGRTRPPGRSPGRTARGPTAAATPAGRCR